MTRAVRTLIALVVLLGVGLLTAVFAVWTLDSQVKQQRDVMRGLATQNAENTQALSEQQRLARALAAQVRRLGATPVTLPPSQVATPRSSVSIVVVPATSPTRSGQRPSATPAPTPRPTRSQSPTPTPSPSRTCTAKIGPVCL